MIVKRYLPVMGTHGWSGVETGDWWCPDSPFTKMLEPRGLVLISRDEPYVWSTDVGGAHFWQLGKKMRGDHRDWAAGGRALFHYLVPPLEPYKAIPPVEVNIISHSHGLQVVLYAASRGLKIHRLIDVSGPVRDDMMPVAAAARPNIEEWLHLHSDRTDRMQWLGELFDGAFGVVREHPHANRNVSLGSLGHSRILQDPTCYPLWESEGLIDFLLK